MNLSVVGSVVSVVLVVAGVASYHNAAIDNLDSYHAAIAELRQTQSWTTTPAELDQRAAREWSARPAGAHWQEHRDVLARATRDLDVPAALANDLDAYLNALDARAKALGARAEGPQSPGNALASLPAGPTTNDLATSADALVHNLTSHLNAKQSMASWYKQGMIAAVVGLAVFWIVAVSLHVRTARPSAPLSPATRDAGGAKHQRRGLAEASTSGTLGAPGKRAAATMRQLRAALVAELVATRLAAAAQRMGDIAIETRRMSASNAIATRIDDEAAYVATLAARIGAFRADPDAVEIVNVADCADQAAQTANVQDAVGAGGQNDEDRGAMVVEASAPAILLMLVTLLENAARAVRFAVERQPDYAGRVAISCRREPEHVVVAVTDNGIGMSPLQRERAFLPFCSGWSEGASTEPHRSLGVGLAITAKLVETYGGTVSLGSLPGGGTVAQIKLPAATPANDVMDQPSASKDATAATKRSSQPPVSAEQALAWS